MGPEYRWAKRTEWEGKDGDCPRGDSLLRGLVCLLAEPVPPWRVPTSSKSWAGYVHSLQECAAAPRAGRPTSGFKRDWNQQVWTEQLGALLQRGVKPDTGWRGSIIVQGLKGVSGQPGGGVMHGAAPHPVPVPLAQRAEDSEPPLPRPCRRVLCRKGCVEWGTRDRD